MTQIGTVKAISGVAQAVNADGVSRVLVMGDPIFEGEIISTIGTGSSIQLSFDSGRELSLSGDEKSLLDETVYGKEEFANADVTAAKQALLDGGELPADATAAGADAPVDNDGFVPAYTAARSSALGDVDTYNLGTDATPPASLDVNDQVQVNEAPEAVDDVGVAVEEGAGGEGQYDAPQVAIGNVLGNDTDDGLPNPSNDLDVTGITSGNTPNAALLDTDGNYTLVGEFGTLVLNAETGEYAYTVDDANPIVNAQNINDTLTENFNYTVSDGLLDDTANLTITINGANDAPIAVDDRTGEDGGLTIVQGEIVPRGTYTGGDGEDDYDYEEGSQDYPPTPEGLPGTSIDAWSFTHKGGPLTIDVLTESGNSEWTDINGDTIQSFLDSMIHLYSVDSEGNRTELFHTEDDDGGVGNDGSTSGLDSFLSLSDLPAGNYVLEISDYEFNENEIGQTYQDDETPSYYNGGEGGQEGTYGIGHYQISFDGNVQITSVPELGKIVSQGESSGNNAVEEGTAGDEGSYDAPVAATGNVLDNDTDVDNAHSQLSVVDVDGTAVSTLGEDTTITGLYGTLTMHSDGSFSYVADDDSSAVDSLDVGERQNDVFTYTVSDNEEFGAKTDTATLTITIEGTNDAPTLFASTGNGDNAFDLVLESGLSNGTNPSDADKTATGTFTIGDVDGLDDIASITVAGTEFVIGTGQGEYSDFDAISNADTAINTTYGEVTIDGYSNGTFTYTYVLTSPAHNTDPIDGEIAEDTFVVRVSDEGKYAETTVTISIDDDEPMIIGTVNGNEQHVDNLGVHLDDDALAGGNAGGEGDDVDAKHVEGTLSHSYGADGAGTVLLAGAKVPEGFTSEVSEDGTTLTISQGDTAVLSVVLTDTTSGAYTVTQLAPISHPDGLDENNVKFNINYTVTDSDGDSVDGSMKIHVDDDTPTITTNPIDEQSFELNLTNLDLVSSAGYNSSFGYYEKDGNGDPTGDGVVVWDGVHNDKTATVTIEGHEPSEIGFFIIPNGNANTGLSNGNAVTFIQVGGEWQATLDGITPLASAAGHILFDNSALNFDANTGAYTYQVDNGLPGNLNWEDLAGGGDRDNNDVNINADWTQTGPLGVDESDLSRDATFDLSSAFNFNFGADGAASVNAIAYNLSVQGGNSELFDTLTNSEVQLHVVNGSVIGSVTEGSGDVTVFTLSVDANGVATLDQQRAVVHADGSNPDDSTGIASGLISLNATITDGDGDSTSNAIDVGSLIRFEDDAPIAFDDSKTATEDTNTVVGGNVLTNDLTGSDTAEVSSIGTQTGTYGSVEFFADGDYTYTLNNDATNVQSLAEGQKVSDSFDYIVTDKDGDSDTATLTININGTNDAPEVSDKSVALDADADASGISFADYAQGGAKDVEDDTDGDKVTQIKIESLPTDGILSVGGVAVIQGDVFAETDTFDYTSDYSEPVLFGTKNDDGNKAEWGTFETDGTVTLSSGAISGTITGSNSSGAKGIGYQSGGIGTHDGTGIGVSGSTDNSQIELNGQEALTITFGAPIANAEIGLSSVGGNFVEGGDDKPDATAVWTATLNGDEVASGAERQDATDDGNPNTVVINIDVPFDTIVFTVDGNKNSNYSIQYVEVNPQLEDSFTYSAIDSDGTSSGDIATVTLSGAATNFTPDASNDNLSTDEDTPLTINVATLLENDTDSNGDALEIISVDSPSNGTVRFDGDGNIVFTPTANYSGPASFTYEVSDGHGGTDTATVNLNINPVADAPTLLVSIGEPIVTGGNVLEVDFDTNDVYAYADISNAFTNNILTTSPANTGAIFNFVNAGNGYGVDTTSDSLNAEASVLNGTATTSEGIVIALDTATSGDIQVVLKHVDNEPVFISGYDVSGNLLISGSTSHTNNASFTYIVPYSGTTPIAYVVISGADTDNGGKEGFNILGVSIVPSDLGSVAYEYTLNIEAALTDSSETLSSITIGDLPSGGTLYIDGVAQTVATTYDVTADSVVTIKTSSEMTTDEINTISGSVTSSEMDGTTIIDTATTTETALFEVDSIPLASGDFDNSYIGTDGNDLLLGTDDADIMTGGFGNDTIYGGAGNDTLIFDAADSLIDGGDDYDTLVINDATIVSLDLTNVHNVEVIDLNDTTITTELTSADVFGMTSGDANGDHDLIITGTGTVNLTTDTDSANAVWTETGTDTNVFTATYNDGTTDHLVTLDISAII